MSTSSLERIVPDEIQEDGATGQEALRLHLERYRFASTHANPGRALDIACGVGYGTNLLFNHIPDCHYALGVDCSPESIGYAQSRYKQNGMDFMVSDATTFMSDTLFDSIISLETIEHLPYPLKFLAHLLSLLRPGGTLIASVPTTPTVDANPYHLHDFTEKDFRSLTSTFPLHELASLHQRQSFYPMSILTQSESRLKDLRPNLCAYYAKHPSALMKRVWSTLRFGFSIRYLTIAFRYQP